jgi:hypothetical protein
VHHRLSFCDANTGRIALLVSPTRVMNVIVTVSRAERVTYMKTFTIDADNNISVFTSKKEAAAASATPSIRSPARASWRTWPPSGR